MTCGAYCAPMKGQLRLENHPDNVFFFSKIELFGQSFIKEFWTLTKNTKSLKYGHPNPVTNINTRF